MFTAAPDPLRITRVLTLERVITCSASSLSPRLFYSCVIVQPLISATYYGGMTLSMVYANGTIYNCKGLITLAFISNDVNATQFNLILVLDGERTKGSNGFWLWDLPKSCKSRFFDLVVKKVGLE